MRGDDGLGWHIAQRLTERTIGRAGGENGGSNNLEVLALHQLTPELAEVISRSKFVFFIDASCNQEPGSLCCRVIKPNSNLSKATTHHLDPPGLLSFAQELYETYPDMVILLSVGGKMFGYMEGLSHIVSKALPILEEVLDAYIGTIIALV